MAVTPNRRLPARTDWPRLLDPVRSIKAKLGLLVVASVIVTAMLTWYGIAILGWWPRTPCRSRCCRAGDHARCWRTG